MQIMRMEGKTGLKMGEKGCCFGTTVDGVWSMVGLTVNVNDGTRVYRTKRGCPWNDP